MIHDRPTPLRGVLVSDPIRRPYVYSVKARDMNGLQEAVHAALTHPIKSYIPDNMSFRFATERLHDMVEGDWRGKAQAILIERLHSGWGEVSAGAGRSTRLAAARSLSWIRADRCRCSSSSCGSEPRRCPVARAVSGGNPRLLLWSLAEKDATPMSAVSLFGVPRPSNPRRTCIGFVVRISEMVCRCCGVLSRLYTEGIAKVTRAIRCTPTPRHPHPAATGPQSPNASIACWILLCILAH